ncbi:MAG TPA: AEC family transporter [Phycisphaerales bacterium]|nr:AEC family transporter [Phycisphaerales bacterium]
MHLVNTLVPVFLLIGLGFVLRKSNFLTGDLVGGINKLVYWVGLPALLFIEVATAAYDLGRAATPFFAMFIAISVCIVVAYWAAAALKLSGPSVGAFVQGTFHGNTVYVGLPVLAYSVADLPGVDAPQTTQLAVLVLAMIMPFYLVASVIVLLLGRHRLDRSAPRRIARRLITNPFILACVAGLCWGVSGLHMPWAIQRAFDATAQMALPLALIATGAMITGRKSGVISPAALWSTAIKIGVGPLAGYLAGKAMGLDTGQMHVVLILLAVPTAVSSLVLADQLDSDSGLAADIIVISSVLSIGSLAAVLAIA